MTSARKEAAKTLALTDVVIEVCDARLPEASSNPMIRELRLHRQRPCLKLLNKADLADRWTIPEADLAELASSWTVLRTSAKSGEGVEAATRKLLA
mgnify:CR=1 FL=1